MNATDCGALGHQRLGVVVDHVPGLAGSPGSPPERGRATRRCPPLSTRDTVPRETPASAATSSIVEPPPCVSCSVCCVMLHRAGRDVGPPVPLQRTGTR